MEIDIEKRQRISSIQGIFMLAVAGIIDGVQFLLNFIPFVGWIATSLISVFAWLTFFTWFKLNGVGFLSGKTTVLKIASIFGVSILEIFPIINDFPAWIVYIVIMIFIVKAEDTIFNKTGKNIEIRKILKK